jgi:hypothetical protein
LDGWCSCWDYLLGGLFGQQILAVSDVLLGRGLVGIVQARARSQVFLEAANGIVVAPILLETSALVEDECGVLGVDEEVG